MKKYYSYLLLLPLSLGVLTGCSASEDHTNEVASTGSIKDKINEQKQKNSEEDKDKKTEDKKTSETEQEKQETTEKEEKIPLDTADQEATEAHQKTKDSPQHTSVNNNRPWNPEKAAQLKQFMLSWQQEMGQKYLESTPEQPITTRISDFATRSSEHRYALGQYDPDEEPHYISLAYDPTGISDADYTIVAVYDTDPAVYMPPDPNYYFALDRQNQPVVLTFTQTQALPNNMFYVYPTQNTALQQGFADIVHQTN